ncbi:MAG: TolC family protein [Pedobacter sp.]|uniref:TolC family protein n=1 Tax=Pedobacter sp. TaxID=1411316 RepID=UPI00339156F6
MKKISTLSFIIAVLFCLQASAQNTIMSDVNYPLLDKYISLAKQNYPRMKISEGQMESLKQNISMAKVSFLDLFNASYYYRPNDNITNNQPGQIYTVNGWQFGFTFNLGTYLQKPYALKKAKADYRVSGYQYEDTQLTTTSEVKRRYYAYLQSVSQLKIRTQTAQDNKNISETSRHKFERGELSLDLYNASRMLVSTSSTDQIQAEVNYLNAKDALEEIIGKKLSEVK